MKIKRVKIKDLSDLSDKLLVAGEGFEPSTFGL